MMRTALIDRGKATHVWHYPKDVVVSRYGIDGLLVEAEDATPGMVWDGVALKAPPRPVQPSRVDDEWQRRLTSSFQFAGKTYDAGQDSQTTILAYAQWAADAVAAHVQAGNLYWQADDPSNPTEADLPFAYKATDGTLVQMDAPTVVEFGKALSQHRQALFRAAQALKAMTPIPTDCRDDKHWP